MDLREHTEGHVFDCVCGRKHIPTIKDIISGRGAVKKLPDAVRRLGGKKAFIIADESSYGAAGKTVTDLLDGAKIPFTLFIFDVNRPKPDEKTMGSLVFGFDKTCDIIISVGSGVINDNGKILSNVTGLPYILVGTAPSMDGFASDSSSMEVAGRKVSLKSHAADIIIGDTDILKTAPDRMLVAGIGDMVAKYVSLCEWRVSNLITGEYYCPFCADLVRTALKRCVDNADGLLARKDEAIEAVFEGLVLSGFAMTYTGISIPASGVEHYISHLIDMRALEFGTPCDFHGTQCAVGTYAAISVYDKIRKITLPDKERAIKTAEAFDLAKWHGVIRELVGHGAEALINQEKTEKKYELCGQKERVDKIISNWDEILRIMDEELPHLDELDRLYDKLGCPKHLSDIGIDDSYLPILFKASKDIRKKYTLARLLWDLGLIDEMAEGLAPENK